MTKFTMHVRISTAIRVLAVVCAVWASVFPAAAQDDILNVAGIVTDEADRKKLIGVEVSVTRDGAPFDALTTDAKGAYDFQLPLRHDYVFSFTYAGYGVKRIRVDGSKVPPEDLKGGFRLDMPMSLFKLVDGFNTAILEDYYGKASFDPIKNTIAFDFSHTERMRNKVKQEFDRVARMAGDLAKMREDFAALLAKGKTAMTASKWDQALTDFTAALAIFPDDAEALQLQKQAQAKVDEQAASASADKKFQDALKAAEADLKADKLDSAAERFRGAAALKPSAPEPADGLKRVEARRTVLAADEAYRKAIADADALFAAAKYAEAAKAYGTASGMKPAEVYPKTRKADAERMLADAAAAAAALAEKTARYETLIVQADKAFKAKSYKEAKGSYEEAGRILPTEPYPKERAAACQAELDKATAAAAASASAAAAAASAAAAAAELDAKYAAQIGAGDAAFAKSDWEAAKAAYRKALDLKPSESYPTGRLDRIAKEEKAAASAADAAAQAAARKAAEEEERKQLEEERARKAAADAAKAADAAAAAAAKKAADEEAARLAAERKAADAAAKEAERLRAEQERVRAEEERARLAAQREADAVAAAAAKRAADEEAARRAAEQKATDAAAKEAERLRIEQERVRMEEERARLAAQREADELAAAEARKVAEAEAARAAAERKAAEAAEKEAERIRAEEERARRAEEQAAAVAARKAAAEEEARLEAQRRQEAEAERKRLEEEQARLAAERAAEVAAAKVKEEAELARLREEEAARAAARAEARKQQEEEARQRAALLAGKSVDQELDEAEQYYADARTSEERARDEEVMRRKETASAQEVAWSTAAGARTAGARQAGEEQKASQAVIAAEGAAVQATRDTELAAQRGVFADNAERAAAVGEASVARGTRRVERAREDQAAVGAELTDQYRTNFGAVDRLRNMFTSQDQRAAADQVRRTSASFEERSRGIQRFLEFGQGHDERIAANYAETERLKAEHDAWLASRAVAAERAALEARIQAEELAVVQPHEPEELLDPTLYGTPEGVSEQSYDIPNGLVIERTVRIGNKIRKFRKVITKSGVYYFEGERSITQETWQRETELLAP